MSAEGAEIDLYDNIEEDFVHEGFDNSEFNDEVAPISILKSGLEDSISPNSDFVNKPHTSIKPTHTGRRVPLYVGNLTWWTSDSDLLDAAKKIGVVDILEVKFHENRQNGQSKGFCALILGSDQSARILMDKFSKTSIHGQFPVVTNCTKQNLTMFEKAADDSSAAKPGASPAPPKPSTSATPAALGFSLRNTSSLMGQAVGSKQPAQNNSTRSSSSTLGFGLHQGSAPLLPAPNNTGGTASAMFPNMFPPTASMSSLLPTSINTGSTSTHVNPNFIAPSGLFPTNIPPPMGPPPGLMSNQSMFTSAMPPTMNPALSFSQRPPFETFNRPNIHTYIPSSTGGSKLNESEFEDILQRNKTVSSSAITRAVQDASSGDFPSAIETLVTAISLIRQSKIASDDRCRFLINSLQDTLNGIESKSYSTKSSSSSRRRRRSYSDSGSDVSNEDDAMYDRRRGRDRSNRSRSRDRHRVVQDRSRRRSPRDRGSSSNAASSYYLLPNMPPTGSSLQQGLLMPANNSNGGSSMDRYRDMRYQRH